MGALYRFGVSLEKELIDAFDRHIEEQHYNNRSEALRDLIREELLKKKWLAGGTVAGAIVMTYDHHKRELVNQLIDIQHDFQDIIISTQHVHLDHHHCLEIIAIRGNAPDVQKLAAILKAKIGVIHLSLSISAAG
ncbi:MAG: nickel-responsive transcriptional regulator NikR [Chlorobi bacterium]|nr:nickel-responsive transcriptional regulator NikR [Chlorobiota bacterium]